MLFRDFSVSTLADLLLITLLVNRYIHGLEYYAKCTLVTLCNETSLHYLGICILLYFHEYFGIIPAVESELEY